MAFEQKEGDISIFVNDKRTGDNQPTHRGTMVVNGVKHKISLWTKGDPSRPFWAGKHEVDTYVPTAPAQPAPVQSNPARDEVIPGVDAEEQPLPF